MSYKVASP